MGEGKVVARTYPAGTPIWVRDATANDSDKTFTVPANKMWRIKSVYAELTTTATVGNRTLTLIYTDGTNVMYSIYLGYAQAASLGPYSYTWYPGATRNVTNQPFCNAIPPDVLLPAGHVLRIYDSAAVDAAADDLIVVLNYEELDV